MRIWLHRFCVFSGWVMIALGVLSCLAGIGGMFLLSGVILEEFMNGVRIINDWSPDARGASGFFFGLPSNLALLVNYYPLAAFATLIFFPLVVVLMPIYAGFFLDDWTVALFGWVPFLNGLVLVVCGLIFRELFLPKGAKRKKPLKTPKTPSAPARE